MKKGSKQWWKLAATIMGALSKSCSIPALKNDEGSWITSLKDKANMLAASFKSKNVLPDTSVNEFTTLKRLRSSQDELFFPVIGQTLEELEGLREDSGTGPDQLPARILKKCSRQLAKPITILIIRILATGIWPELWKDHWIVPLFKKGSSYLTENYRGVHLTAQMSKITERVIKKLFMPHIHHINGYGHNQFAYTEGRGARDALAFLMIEWIVALNGRDKIIIYNSDVSGAFDRVSVERLVSKLKAKGFHPRLIAVIKSWLQQRRARVVVGGETSDDIFLFNMIFQGTVLGPPLWNLFFEDARIPIQKSSFKEIVFADDLNAYKRIKRTVRNNTGFKYGRMCQHALHKWGEANNVTFDPKKESMSIISRDSPEGDGFKILGVRFDTSLYMAQAVLKLSEDANWKVRTILRTKRFHNREESMNLY